MLPIQYLSYNTHPYFVAAHVVCIVPWTTLSVFFSGCYDHLLVSFHYLFIKSLMEWIEYLVIHDIIRKYFEADNILA